MNQNYDKEIKKIKRKRRVVNIVMLIIIFSVLFLCTPIELTILGEEIINYDGLSLFIAIPLLIFLLFCWGTAYASVSLPLNSSMDHDGDPERHLALNSALNKNANLDVVCASDYFYLGDFRKTLECAEKMISNPKTAVGGLFLKARCQFFLDDIDAFSDTAEKHKAHGATVKAKKKNMELLKTTRQFLDLLLAIALTDKEKIEENKDVAPWTKSKATEIYVNYIKGVAANVLDDNENAVFYFTLVTKTDDKTVFSRLAKQQLEMLKAKQPTEET